MRYADPGVCAGCRNPLAADLRCRSCGLDLSTPEGGRVWEALQAVDVAVATARTAGEQAAARRDRPAPTAEGTTAPAGASTTEPLTAGLPPAPPASGGTAPAPAAAPRRHVGVGTVILALGALALLVAGAIFITVYWGPMGVLGRAIVLLALTAVVGGAAHLVTRRGLRASAEALWTVFLGFLALDWFQAHAQGLLGLDAVDASAWTAAWAILTVAVACVVVRSGRGRLDDGVELVTVSVLGGVAGWVGAGAVADLTSSAGATPFWAALPSVVAAAAAAAVLARATARLGSWVASAAAIAGSLFATGAAVVEAVSSPSLRELAVEGQGVPLALVVALAAAVSFVGRLGSYARSGATLVAAGGAGLLVALPAEDAWPGRGGLLVCGVAAAALVWARGASAHARGLRAAGVLPALVAAGALLPWAGVLVAGVEAALQTDGDQPLGHRLPVRDVPGADTPWLGATLAVLVGLVVLGVSRWRAAAPVRLHAPVVASGVVLAVAAAVVADADPSALVLALTAVIAAVVVWVVADRTGAATAWAGWWWACAGVLAVAPVLAVDSWWACVVVWVAAAALLLLAALRLTDDPVARGAGVLVGTVWGAGAVGPLVLAVGGPGGDGGEVLVGALLVSGLAALVAGVTRVHDVAARTGVEVAAAIVVAASFVLSDARATTLQVAVSWCVVAVVLAVLAGTRHGRRVVHLAVSAAAALVGAALVTGDWPAAAGLWPVAAAVLVLGAVQARERLLRDALAGLAAGVGIAAAIPVLELAAADDRLASLVLVLLAVLVGGLGSRLLTDRRGRIGVELAAASWAVAAVALGAGTTSTAWTALLLTVLGAVLVVVSLLVADRSWLRLPGSAALAIAYVLRLVASDVGVVEAYTLPFAVLLLAAGTGALLRGDVPASWSRPWGGESVVALSPGLVLGLLPSLPQALDDPTSPRGVVLGLVALTILVAGVRLRWKAPFVAGAVVVGLVLLVQLGPAAIALPRWVLIGVVGVTFLTVGATWENRVRDGRSAVHWVGAMR